MSMCYYPQIGRKEAEWMLANWKLKRISGYLHDYSEERSVVQTMFEGYNIMLIALPRYSPKQKRIEALEIGGARMQRQISVWEKKKSLAPLSSVHLTDPILLSPHSFATHYRHHFKYSGEPCCPRVRWRYQRSLDWLPCTLMGKTLRTASKSPGAGETYSSLTDGESSGYVLGAASTLLVCAVGSGPTQVTSTTIAI